MGSSFANIHVRIAESDSHSALEIVMDDLVAWLADRGFHAVQDGEASNRNVFVAVDPGGRWINVYDEATNLYEDDQAFNSLPHALALSLDTFVVAAAVQDSDLAWIALFDRAGQVGELHVGKEKLETRPDDQLALDLRPWEKVLRPGASLGDVRRVIEWHNANESTDRYLFAEERVADLCELLGITRERSSIGYRYAFEAESEVDPAGMRLLRFQGKLLDPRSPDVEEALDESRLFPTGLLLIADDEVITLPPGERVSLSANIVNVRPEAVSGLRIRVSTAESTVFSPTSVRATHFCESREHEATAPIDGLSTIDLTGYRLEAWPVLEGAARYNITLWQVAHSQGQLHVIGHAVDSGSGTITLEVSALPDSADRGVSARVSFHLRVR